MLTGACTAMPFGSGFDSRFQVLFNDFADPNEELAANAAIKAAFLVANSALSADNIVSSVGAAGGTDNDKYAVTIRVSGTLASSLTAPLAATLAATIGFDIISVLCLRFPPRAPANTRYHRTLPCPVLSVLSVG